MIRVAEILEDRDVRRTDAGLPAPRVSVILPTYRRRQSLGRAIRSVLDQGFRELELLVMDDGSTDGSEALIAELQGADPRLVHVRHAHNCGLPGLRVNEGIELSRGRLLAFQFDDDEWCPGALEALVSAHERTPEPSVVVGHSRFASASGEWTLPAVPVDLVTLHEQNRFANNAVLFPRELVERHGMYDCHIGMRRLCDWDLWLRYIRHVPFVVIDETVSRVYESTAGSIGLTVPLDLPLFRYLHDIPRDGALTPGRWREYEVDALSIAGVGVEKDYRRRLYEEHIVPYYMRFRHRFPRLEGFPATLPERRTVLYTKNSYDVSNDVTLNHYDPATSERGTYKAHYQPLAQVQPDWTRQADALLLVRTVEAEALPLARQALAEGVPLGLYLDDDLLSFHEYGPEYSYLAPGTPYHGNLMEGLRLADTVWVTNEFIERSVGGLSSRVIPHNNAVPAAMLPERLRAREPGRPLRIGYVGSGYRIEEFRRLWPALLQLSEEHGDSLRFEFWGLDVSSLPPLRSPWLQRPFCFSYGAYLRRLQQAEFDVLLTPLLASPRPRLAKSLIKYYECAVAGALGIFSDVPQYASLPNGVTCLKADNTPEAWHEVLERAVRMPTPDFDRIRLAAFEHVREEYTEQAQIHKHEAAWRATEFHARTRALRHDDGRPRVAYALHSAHFGGGEIQLWRRLRRARRYGIEPVVVLPRVLEQTEAAMGIAEGLRRERIEVHFLEYSCFDNPRSPAEFKSSLECDQIRDFLLRVRPCLVHTVTFIPSMGQVCAELGIPHVASLYAVADEFAWRDGKADFVHAQIVQSDSQRYARRWSQLLGVEKFVAREVAPEEVFALGQRRRLERLGRGPAPLPPLPRLVVTGTLQERKQQLETIEAVGRLKRRGLECLLDLYGYTHFFPAYTAACEERVRVHRLEQRVRFPGFSADVASILEQADVVLSLSTYESFPSAIKEAMSAGVLVVATPVGGVAELIVDGITGVLCADTSTEAIVDAIERALGFSAQDRARIVEHARRVARSEFHPDRAVSDLLAMYNRGLEIDGGRRRDVPPPEPPARPAVPLPASAARIVAPLAPPAGHALLSPTLRYRVKVAHGGWTGLDVLVGTHGGRVEGELRLRIASPEGVTLRETSVPLLETRDHDWLGFQFEPIANSAGTTFRVDFQLAGVGAESRVSLYEATRMPSRPLRVLRRYGVPVAPGDLYCRQRYAMGS